MRDRIENKIDVTSIFSTLDNTQDIYIISNRSLSPSKEGETMLRLSTGEGIYVKRFTKEMIEELLHNAHDAARVQKWVNEKRFAGLGEGNQFVMHQDIASQLHVPASPGKNYKLIVKPQKKAAPGTPTSAPTQINVVIKTITDQEYKFLQMAVDSLINANEQLKEVKNKLNEEKKSLPKSNATSVMAYSKATAPASKGKRKESKKNMAVSFAENKVASDKARAEKEKKRKEIEKEKDEKYLRSEQRKSENKEEDLKNEGLKIARKETNKAKKRKS